MEFSIDHNNELFLIKLFREADPKNYDELFDALSSHDRWMPDSAILSDETELEVAHLTVSEVEAIAHICGKWRQKLGAAKIATFVENDLTFGMNRMWEVFAARKSDVIHGTFRSKNEALDWLSNKTNAADAKSRAAD